MKSRLTRLPDNRIPTTIASLQQQIRDLKTAQSAGSQAVQLNQVQSTSAYDIQLTVTAGTQSIALITYTPPSTLGYSGLPYLGIANIVTDSAGHGAGTVSDVGFTGYGNTYMSIERYLPTPTQQTWQLYVQPLPSPPSWIQFKFVFFAVGQGTFSAVQTH